MKVRNKYTYFQNVCTLCSVKIIKLRPGFFFDFSIFESFGIQFLKTIEIFKKGQLFV